MNIRGRLAVLPLLFAGVSLTACGGGGQGPSSTPPPPVSPGPTPSPSPSPTPTPTPAPTPTPTPTPPPAGNSDLLGPLSSQTFANDAARAQASFNAQGSTGTVSAPAVTLRYDAANQSYNLTTPTGTIAFLPSDIDNASSNAGAIVYTKTNGNTTDTLTLTRPGTSGPITYRYVGGAFWQRTVQTGATSGTVALDAIAYGIPTINTALPRTGTASFAVDLIGARSVGTGLAPIAGVGTTFVDFANLDVITSGRLTAGGVTGGTGNSTFNSIARLSSTGNAFSGNFTLNDFGQFVGTLDGRFYGPGAEEIGAAIRATLGTDVLVATLLGRRGTGAQANTRFNTDEEATQPGGRALAASDFFTADSARFFVTLPGRSGSNFTGAPSAAIAESGSIRLLYDRDANGYTLIGPDRSSTLLPPYVQDDGTGREELGPGVGTVRVDLTPPINLTYTRAGFWRYSTAPTPTTARERVEHFVYGFATPDAALPRAGSASYNIRLGASFADPSLPNLVNAQGAGVLGVNFATGAITGLGTVAYGEDFFLSGRPRGTAQGNFNLTAALSSTANAFNGSISLTGLGNYTGSLAGRFFGPGADEVGAQFSVTSPGGGVGAGTLVGVKDPTATVPPGAVTLLDLPGPTELASASTIVGAGANIGFLQSVNFDPVANRYIMRFNPNTTGDGPTDNLTLAFASRDVTASNAERSVYRGTFLGTDYVATISRPGNANPLIALTYTSWSTFAVRDGRVRYYNHHGLATPDLAMPRSGSATYNGVVTGFGTSSPAPGGAMFDPINYNLSGTGSLTANFGNSSFSSRLDIAGTPEGSTAVRTFGQFDFNGSITGNRFSGGINGNSLMGAFYGPEAAELAGLFNIIVNAGPVTAPTERIELNGLFLGKKAP